MKQKGFTLIELLVVIAIVGILAAVVLISLNKARESSKISRSVMDQRQLINALELYYNDVGFYPPDVGRGWDPGFSQALPYNPDTGQTDTPSCPHCPSNWVSHAQANWKGPYIARFPNTTVWNGKYDYNYWGSSTSRYGCSVPAGIYFGIQRDYADMNPIPPSAEQQMLDKGFDGDGCLNGEVQMLLNRL